MKRRLFLVLTLLLVASLLVAPTLAQDSGKVLTISYTQEPDTLSPLYTTMWFSANIIDLVLTPPWFIDNNLKAVPVQVTEIPSVDNGGVSKDGKVLTMKLRSDLKWSDGEPITAKDYVFTYEMLINDKNTVSSRYPWDTKVAKVEAPDDTTVVVTFKEPFAPWLTQLYNATPAIPEHVLRPIFEQDGTLDKADWNRSVNVSSGPFTLQEWESGSHLTLVRNDNYFGGKAKLDQVFVRIVPDDAAQIAGLKAGDVDVGPFIAPPDAVELKKDGLEVVQTPSGYNEAWFFNVNPKSGHPALQDVKVRQALAMAFNRDKINKDLNLDTTHTAASYWEGTPYANPDVKPYPYDPDQAAKMLDDAGWKVGADGIREKDGKKLELRYLSTPRQIRKDVQAVVQQDFQKLGIKLDLQNPSSDVFFNSYGQGGPVATGQFDIAEWSQNPSFPDPDTSVFSCSEIPSDQKPEGSNWTGYCNKDVDSLLQQQLTTVDTNQRIEMFHKIDQMIHDDAVWVGVWYDADIWAYNKRVQNAEFSGADPFWNAVNWDLSS
jgi:peptide/nickel transport system substrate-binding protein